MKGNFKRKIACLLFVCIFMVTSLVGCGDEKKNKKDSVTENNTGEVSASIELTSDISDEESKEEQTSIVAEVTTEESTEEIITETTTETTTTAAPTTTVAPTTKKPADKTTQKTTAKPKPVEQTTTAPKVSKAEQMAKEIVDDIITSNMTQFEKALTIHDWLIFNLDYDFTYSNYYVEETLRDRRCVCQGYALTFKMMCEMAGLDVIYVTGKGYTGVDWGGHAWNQVKIDGKWYNVDVTWDDPASPGKDFNNHVCNSHEYFLISDSTINKDHNATSSGRQSCPSDYDRATIVKAATNNVYHSDFEFASNDQEFAAGINKAAEANKSRIYIKYYDPNVTTDTMWNGIFDRIKQAKYPADIEAAYAPAQGVTTYVIKVMPASEFNKAPVVTSNEQLEQVLEDIYNSGKTSITLRYEPTDGDVWFGSDKYIFEQKDRKEYNGGKSIYTTIEITGLQTWQ